MSLSTSPSSFLTRFLQLDWRLVQPSHSLRSSMRRVLTRKKMDESGENCLFDFVVFGVDPSEKSHWLANDDGSGYLILLLKEISTTYSTPFR